MAGASPKPEEGKKKARIEIIPLIDVVFFLLATFVLFALSLNKIESLPVQLPQASQSTNNIEDKTLVTLQISEAGTCYWNKDPIDFGEIGPRLASYKQKVENPHILLTGDDRAKFGPVAVALDQIRKAGIEQVSVETRVRPTGQ
jgi:biopolymer transport protein ExbD